jgi:RsiW-degrading membrane proteinase PrsW (M82 family)
MTWGLFLLAIAPVVAVIWFIYHKDKYEHEPWGYLVLAYVFGLACAAVVPFITGKIQWLPELYSDTQMEVFLTAFVVIALVEEFMKFIILRGDFF